MEAGEILLKSGLLDQRQLDLSRRAQSEGVRLDQAAVELGFVSEESALTALGKEAGLRFVDVDEDGRLDLVFSNHERYGVWLFTSFEQGWRCVLSGKRGEKDPKDELPMFVRADGTNNISRVLGSALIACRKALPTSQ